MKQDLSTSSVQFISSVFATFEQQNEDYVFWIRDGSMTKQIYHSSNFSKFWGCSAETIYDMPMLWINFLEQDNLSLYMSQLQERHNNNYLDADKNLAYYKVTHLDGFNNHMKDNCFRCRCPLGREYIVGISKNIKASQWQDEFQLVKSQWSDDDGRIHRHFLKLLHDNFDLKLIQLEVDKNTQIGAHRENFTRQFNYKLTRRELECLYHLCRGDTAKQTAFRLNLSTRTVEKHLESVRIKTDISTKLLLVIKFSHYFSALAAIK